MEKAGTGIKRMRDAMLKHGLKEPKFDISEYFFIATFHGHTREKLEGIAQGADVVALNERQKKAVEYLGANERLATSDYVELTGITKRTAIRDLKDLVAKGILEIKGNATGRGRFYALKSEKGDTR